MIITVVTAISLIGIIAVGVFLGHFSSLIVMTVLANIKQQRALKEFEDALGINKDDDKIKIKFPNFSDDDNIH